ncbi:uncharacterized protein RSE6_00460 [Rhynchosporium secalis]|uniref:Uncharacterized protein n=1 Tax=Rhynchosporium secalis TaxID=38038 RepID=A0A1E1LVC1_RHYSE|nr:uncharacterized protein RSE6_00460 [Rhynchosporium secalis]
MKRPRIDVAVASIIHTANSRVDGKGASQEEKWREGERGLSITGLNVLTLSILTEPDLIGVREISANTGAGGIDRASIRELCCVQGIVAEAIPAADGMRYDLGQQTCATFGCLRGLCFPFFRVYDCRGMLQCLRHAPEGSKRETEQRSDSLVRLLKQALPVDEIKVQLMRLPDQLLIACLEVSLSGIDSVVSPSLGRVEGVAGVLCIREGGLRRGAQSKAGTLVYVQARGMAIGAEEQKRLGGVDKDQVVESTMRGIQVYYSRVEQEERKVWV